MYQPLLPDSIYETLCDFMFSVGSRWLRNVAVCVRSCLSEQVTLWAVCARESPSLACRKENQLMFTQPTAVIRYWKPCLTYIRAVLLFACGIPYFSAMTECKAQQPLARPSLQHGCVPWQGINCLTLMRTQTPICPLLDTHLTCSLMPIASRAGRGRRPRHGWWQGWRHGQEQGQQRSWLHQAGAPMMSRNA